MAVSFVETSKLLPAEAPRLPRISQQQLRLLSHL
jgi:hypothetical protein